MILEIENLRKSVIWLEYVLCMISEDVSNFDVELGTLEWICGEVWLDRIKNNEVLRNNNDHY